MTNQTVQTKLDLSDCSSYLPSNLFQPRNAFFNRNQATIEIQQLLLRRNRLESLKIYAKALCHFKRTLTELSLRENQFTKFPLEILVLTNLTSLSLASNQIDTIEQGIFSKLTHLQWVNLSGNRLSDLPADIICCHFLRGIDLENNAFENFPHILFFLTRLEVLLFQRNRLTSIPDEYYFPNSLTTLNLAFNLLKEIPLCLIYHPPEAITHLHLSGNNIQDLPLEFLSIGYHKLVSLDLHTCNIESCPPAFFESLSKCKDLKRLNLAINHLSEIPSEIGLLKQLQWLNLNDNLLESLPSAMADLSQLVKLGLVQNKLQQLPPFLFINMLKLQKLDIRRNLLKYMPPSVLALAPRHEVDSHVDLAAPHSVFYTLSEPPQCLYHLSKSDCTCYTYGGSLRTLLFYENPTIEHIDGILCNLGTEECETVQLMSMAEAFSALRSNATEDSKDVLFSVLFPKTKTATTKATNDNNNSAITTPSLSERPSHDSLSDIDTTEGEIQENIKENGDDGEEEEDTLDGMARSMFTQVASLKEISLRQHLTFTHQSFIKSGFGRLDQNSKHVDEFIDSVIPNSIVPDILHSSIQKSAWQCDYCQRWYTDSQFQIGYLTRLCNNRLQIPIRFNVCSASCILDSIVHLYQASTNWSMRQSLTHIESLIALPTPPPLLPLESQYPQDNRVQETAPQVQYTSSLTRLIKERVAKFATSLFNSAPSDHSSEEEEEEEEDDTIEFSNAATGVENPPILRSIPQDPPSISSVTLQMIENRLQDERTQPHIRLSDPTPNPTAFNHLPGDAIKLERF